MKSFGFSPDQATFLRETLKKHLYSLGKCRVWIFGSRVKNQHRPYSDVDLLIESTPPISEIQLTQLKDELEESDFPFKVDLVKFEDLVPGYRDGILAERQLFWSKHS